MKQILLFGLFLFFTQTGIYAQENDQVEGQQQNPKEHSEEGAQHDQENISYEGLFAPFKKFPNLHALVVHFPVVLIPMALLFQIISFFWYRKEMSISTLILLTIGIAGGLVAAFWLHPHIGDLSPKAYEVFKAHEEYAYWTLSIGGAALLLKLISFYFLNNNKIAEISALVLILGATYTISMAGHLGSQMVYIEGIGPKGNKLEQHNH